MHLLVWGTSAGRDLSFATELAVSTMPAPPALRGARRPEDAQLLGDWLKK